MPTTEWNIDGGGDDGDIVYSAAGYAAAAAASAAEAAEDAAAAAAAAADRAGVALDRYYFTASVGQTVFSGADDNDAILETSNMTSVYLNGALLAETDDYTKTETTVTLVNSAEEGDEISILALRQVSTSDISYISSAATSAAAAAASAAQALASANDAEAFADALMKFETRAELVAWRAEPNVPVNGRAYIAGNMLYLGQTGATAFSDLADMVPFGDVYVDHFLSTTDTAALTAAWAYAVSVGKEVHFDAREYQISAATTLTMATVALAAGQRSGLVGKGASKTRIRPTSAISSGAWMLTINGPTWGTGGVKGSFTMKGIEFNGVDYARHGVRIARSIFPIFEDVKWTQWDIAHETQDCVGNRYYACNWDFNYRGWHGIPKPSMIGVSNDGSPCNEFVFTGCHFTNNRQYGAWNEYGTELTFIGGSFEANGRPGAWTAIPLADRWDIKLSNSGYNGGLAVTFQGTHFETSGGTAGIWIEHGDYPAVYAINADFVQNGSTVFWQNAIRFDTTGAAEATVVMNGAAFWGVNGYVHSASRRMIAEGTVSGNLHKFFGIESCIFSSNTDAPLTTLPRAEFVKGSNSNGSWTLYPDGRIIAEHTASGVATSTAAGAVFDNGSTLTWTFPVTFSAPPVVFGNAGSTARWLMVGTVDTAAALYRVGAHSSSGTSVAPVLTAIGYGAWQP